MKKALIFVLTNFFILTLIFMGKPVKAQTTTITGQFLYGLQLYVLPEKQTTPDYTTAIYSSTIDENDFITSGLYENWLQPRLPDGINGYIYLVDSTHTIGNVYLGGGYLEQGQTLSYPYEPSIELKHFGAQLIDIFVLNPVNKYYYEAYGGRLDYIVYYETNDGTKPRIKLIDATSNENDYNRVRLSINGYDTGYNAGYSIGFNNGQNNGYNTGYEDGQNNGYNAGYNAGQYDFYNEYYQQIYDDGYNAGLGDRQLGVNKVVDFNQLIPDNKKTITISANTSSYVSLTSFHVNTREKYLMKWSQLDTMESNTRNTPLYSLQANYYFAFGSSNVNLESGNYYWFFEVNDTGNIYLYFWLINENDITIDNINIYNLTQIYGSGNEPTQIDVFNNDFRSNYYPYTQYEIIDIDYENGYKSGYDTAYPIGYDDGKSYQATQQLTSDGWIKNIFGGIGSFLALEILPNVSIGLIVGIPFIISVAWFVIKMARGGGNN